MDKLDRTVVEKLVSCESPPCVSMYMPTQRAGPEVRQGPIRFKNLTKRAQAELDELGLSAGDFPETHLDRFDSKDF